MLECAVFHVDSLGLKGKESCLQQTFQIWKKFYQENVAEASNLLATFYIKFSTLMWSINRLVYNIKAGQPFLLIIGSRHGKNSARMTWFKWLVVFCSSKLIFTWHLQISMDFCCLLDDKYSLLTNHDGWALFWWKQ